MNTSSYYFGPVSASLVLLLTATLFLAYTNGANDNFKGFATLLGSRTLTYRQALTLATITTLAGSLTAVWLGGELVKSFGGKGLVPDVVAADGLFLQSVGFGAAATVLLATRLGFPISTTHAMTGALVGAGLVANDGVLAWARLGSTFFLPLAVSPLLAFLGAVVLYGAARALGRGRGASPALHPPIGAQAGTRRLRPLDLGHVLSATSVSFARGLNDTPKIVGLIAAQALGVEAGLVLVAAAMALGGLLGARRVADTMAHKISGMDAPQGFAANVVTALLVLGASRLGVPVSTTHVSVGAIIGIGVVTRRAHAKMVLQILTAWVTTLPLAMVAAGLVCLLGRAA